MFEVVCTGKNKNYGRKGEKRLLGDNHFMYALKNGIIEPDKFKFVGSYKNNKTPKVPTKQEAMPIKRINVEMTLERQEELLKKLNQRINCLIEVNQNLKKLVKENG